MHDNSSLALSILADEGRGSPSTKTNQTHNKRNSSGTVAERYQTRSKNTEKTNQKQKRNKKNKQFKHPRQRGSGTHPVTA